MASIDKFTRLFRALTDRERSEFLAFCHSPYLNQNKKATVFVEHLCNSQVYLETRVITVNEIPLSLFSGSRKKADQLATLKHQALKLLTQFLGQEELKKEEFQLDFWSAKGVYKRTPKLGAKLLEKLKHKLNSYLTPSTQLSFLQYQVNLQLGHYQVLEKTSAHSAIAQALRHLEQFNLKAQLRLRAGFLNSARLINIDDIEITGGEELINNFERYNTPDYLSILYRDLYLSLKYEHDRTYFEELVNRLLQAEIKDIASEEIHTIFLLCINLCIRRSRSRPNNTYYTELRRKLYNEGTRSKILFEGGYLTEWTYKNAIKTGLQLQLLPWTENFIDQYTAYLTPGVRNNALNYNLAELSFAKRDFDLVLDYLSEVSTNDFRYYLSSKTLIIKTFYETGNMSSCMSAVGSLTVYLSRLKGVSNSIKKGYLHFCQILYQITSIRAEKKVQKIKEKLRSNALLAERDWLQDVFQREHPHA